MKMSKARFMGEPDTAATLRSLMTDTPISPERHRELARKRGEVRRRLEDLQRDKVTEELW